MRNLWLEPKECACLNEVNFIPSRKRKEKKSVTVLCSPIFTSFKSLLSLPWQLLSSP
uniref:Uncharacterized protein n=1 Tax=Arundo donax TaxID=35708 RepID=A0A0A9FBH0_ARUDO